MRHKSRVYGYKNSCPHVADSPLAWRKDAYLNAARTRIVCHGHGAEFDITSGICTLGLCLGQSLTPIVLTTSDAGEVFWLDRQKLESEK